MRALKESDLAKIARCITCEARAVCGCTGERESQESSRMARQPARLRHRHRATRIGLESAQKMLEMKTTPSLRDHAGDPFAVARGE